MRHLVSALSCAGAAFLVILGGCATSGQVASQIVKSNVAQEQAENELLLLNIIRASQRKPMHFTQVSAIHLPVGFGNPTLGLPIPFGGDAIHAYSFANSFAISQSVDTSVQNTQEFMRGITTQLPASTMTYYLDQGWPRGMVLMMFIRKITKVENHVSKTVTNYPEDLQEFERFKGVLSDLEKCDLEVKSDDDKAYGPAFRQTQLDVKALAVARAASMSLAGVEQDARLEPKFQFSTASKGTHLALSSREGMVCKFTSFAVETDRKTDSKTTMGDRASKDDSLTLFIRSPEAMLYYLGEITRSQLSHQYKGAGIADGPAADGFPQMDYDPYERLSKGNKSGAVLFKVSRGTGDDPSLTVAYDDQTFYVARTSFTDQSTHVLSMMSQIIALQNKGSDLPSTATVRVIP